MTTEIVVGSAAGCIAALAMAFYLVAQGMSPVFVGVFSVLCGLVLGAAVFWAGGGCSEHAHWDWRTFRRPRAC
jgi:xanthine/uracil permease